MATTFTATSSQPATLSPAILLVYPATLLLGSLFSVISPTARAARSQNAQPSAPLAPSLAADLHLSPSPVNYFARKNNVFNLYFVKIGWLWTTLAFASLLLFQSVYRSAPSRQSSQPQQQTRLRQSLQTCLRWTLATTVWYLTTQWFFGPAIIDRGFVITGGKCEQALEQVGKASAHVPASAELETLFTAAACKTAGGAWQGGHDISGHVLMLVLATAILTFEAVGIGAFPSFLRTTRPAGDSIRERKPSDPGIPSAGDLNGSSELVKTWVSRFVCGVVLLGWWMLFMTAIWFHTWLEKWSGLFIALSAVYVIYVLPRKLALWRDVVGIPGV
ncbi:Fat storage-inducing transmembrane protein [Penicillium riverlandense]|uniref:Fat storage-inducing transmembrane protein n=1 Tax=Penicillium riverlandense TaxID=1903569 RepID=UPI002546F7EC|nr:Fat storage-inducing transmembrane protein [Penicillium riverlandense]KAJ5818633.1 Fat storage-inducing transmembrane protein [Penicillium riverlandense]